MVRCISIDWLTMYCNSDMIADNPYFDWQLQKGGSAQFKKLFKVYDVELNELYCMVQTEPYSAIIPENTVMVQVSNRFLYRADWNTRFNNFCLLHNITPKAISRIDLCVDFNHFDNNLQPENFIRGFIENKYLKVGQTKYTLQGQQGLIQHYSYLRFGKRENEVSIYLYNKSKELREVQDKPYIRERWEAAGLNMEADVWRLEVSMHTQQLKTISRITGECVRLDLPFLSTMGVVENVLNAAILKYFDFRINDGQLKKCRMKKVELFRGMSSCLELKIIQDKPKTNRIDKIVCKKLANCVTEYRLESEDQQDIINRALALILDKCDLEEYYKVMIKPYIQKYKER